MAESLRENDYDEFRELQKEIAKYKRDNEVLKKMLMELEKENRTYRNDNEDLKHDFAELTYRMSEIQMEFGKYENDVDRMIELEYTKEKCEEHIKELSSIMTVLKIENSELKHYIEDLKMRNTELQKQNEKYKNMVKDVSPKPSNLGKILRYTIIRKDKYPYFINSGEALEELRKKYPTLKEIYEVKYDHEETYSSSRLEKEFKNIDIHDNEILLMNYTEEKFLEDLRNYSRTHQNGCHTFSVIKKHYYSYYAKRVQKESKAKMKLLRAQPPEMKLENRFPNSVEIYKVFDFPNAAILHYRIKENLPKINVLCNHIKLLESYTEEEFIRDVEELVTPMLTHK